MTSKRKPKLGQNFLVDDAACHHIADALGNISNSTVIEIGPGHGAITTILAERARRLICIELDDALAPALQFRFRNAPNVEIVHADILKTDLRSFLGNEKGKVVGNLPYYITSDILLHLFAAADALETAVVMMQREVAERVAAQPGIREYGLLSVTTQLYAEPEDILTLPPSAFNPPPEVYSTVLRLNFAPRLAAFGITDPAAFTQFLRACFAQKRKTLSNNLRAAGFSSAQIQKACEETSIAPAARAEEVSPQQLAQLFQNLKGA